MPIRESLATAYLCWFSSPKADRELYRCIKRNQVRQIVELGMDSVERTVKMLELAQRASGGQEIKYASVDLFEARPESQETLKLKDAHRVLGATGASVRLIPGDVLSGLARAANQLVETDLLIISADCDAGLLERAWMYVPRMLSANSSVYEGGSTADSSHRLLTQQEIDQRVPAKSSNRRAA